LYNISYSRDNVTWQEYHPFLITAIGETTVYYRSADIAGNVEPVKTTKVRIDKEAPMVTYTIDQLPNGNGWYTEPVVIRFQATDGLSQFGTITPPITLSSDGPNQSITGYATDKAGNTGSVTVNDLDLDISAPVTTCKLTPAERGWLV